MPDEWFHLEYVKVVKITSAAVLFELQSGRQWVPISQIASADMDGLDEGDRDGSVCISEWFANKEGLT